MSKAHRVTNIVLYYSTANEHVSSQREPDTSIILRRYCSRLRGTIPPLRKIPDQTEKDSGTTGRSLVVSTVSYGHRKRASPDIERPPRPHERYRLRKC
jgi:hypothetical protein